MRFVKGFAKRVVPDRILTLLRQSRSYVRRYRQHAFDRRFGLDTTAMVWPSDMLVSEDHKKSANPYEATPRGSFTRMLRHLRIEHGQFTFVDIGSGKGAVLLYASHLPFKRIVGVELSQELARIAEDNVRQYVERNNNLQCMNITTLCMDAMRYPIPDGPVILYLANPFKADLMAQLVAHIEQSVKAQPRDVFIVSYNPIVEDVLNSAAWLTRIRTGWNYAIYRKAG